MKLIIGSEGKGCWGQKKIIKRYFDKVKFIN